MISGKVMRTLRAVRQQKNSSAVGKRIKAAREMLDIKQEVMASRLGVSRAALSQWENGVSKKPISFETVQDIAAITGRDAFDLMFGDVRSDHDVGADGSSSLRFHVTGSLLLSRDQMVLKAEPTM